ncbi:MAG: hypothetical protein P4L84_20965 [Isosphaeraceae bacterium]|nr:hypothetical protein [Isosphaeraceae bacterium]
MRRLALMFMTSAVLASPTAADDKAGGEQAAKDKRERLLEIYRNEAASYTIYRDASRKERLELQHDPVYIWTNPVRSAGQDGAVFVWTCRGRAEVLATFFSYPATGPRSLNHELHSLSRSVLDVTRSGTHTWTPTAPGVELKPIAGAPLPASSPSQRLIQMRALNREFTAGTRDKEDKRWELRLLPKPLYRYESTDPDLLDGAVFAFVSTAGTDPEIVLVLEARRPSAGGEPAWHYALARFTDLHFWVRHQGKEVHSGELIPHNLPVQDPQHRYRSFRDRGIPALEDDVP